MVSRTMRIMKMVLQAEEPVTHSIFLPKYESTKGTSKEEQQKCLQEWYLSHSEPSKNQNIYSDIENDEASILIFSDGSSDNYEPSTSVSEDSFEKHIPKKRRKNISSSSDHVSSTSKHGKSETSSENIKKMSAVKSKDCSKSFGKLFRKKRTKTCNLVSPASSHQKTDNQNDIDKRVYAADSSGSTQGSISETFHNAVDSTVADTDEDFIEPEDLSVADNSHNDKAPALFIGYSKKTETGKRVRDKRHACFFCTKLVIHMAQHLTVAHSDEVNVSKLLAFPPKSKNRKEGFSELVRAGDFLYNSNVLSLKEGELILVRRPNRNEFEGLSYADYGPCPYCLGYLLKKHLWHHIRMSCKMKSKSQEECHNNKHVIAESNAMLSSMFGHEFSADFNSFITSHLRDDEIGIYCKEDNLIMRFGSMMYEKHGNTQKELIRQNMRQLARLTLQLKSYTLQNSTLKDFLVPAKFDEIVKATKLLCSANMCDQTKRPQFNIPSLALKLGYALRKCANIERGMALKAGNITREKSLMAFLILMDIEWCTRISSNALTTLKHRKLNVGQLLPITSDLKRLSTYIDTEIEKAKRDLLLTANRENWSRLAKLTLSRIILFNKRRSGEASRMTVEQYSSGPNWTCEATEEIQNSLTDYERKLAERFTVVNIIGKHGRKVPVILTPTTKLCIDLLIKSRDECSVSERNPYIFACCRPSVSSLKGDDCLRKVVSELGSDLKQPTYITGTKLRKYVATVCQVFCLTENEHDWLARHLGHDLTVHREFYRLHEDAVELTKISRLLMAVDTGQANKFKGKKLADINLNELPELEEEDKEREEENALLEEDDKKKAAYKNSNISTIPESRAKAKMSIKSSKHPWTSEEKSAVFTYFKVHIRKNITPRQKECLEFQQKFPLLK